MAGLSHPGMGIFHDLWGGSLITEQNRDGGKPGKSMDREYREEGETGNCWKPLEMGEPEFQGDVRNGETMGGCWGWGICRSRQLEKRLFHAHPRHFPAHPCPSGLGVSPPPPQLPVGPWGEAAPH